MVPMVLPLIAWVLAVAPAPDGPTVDVLLSRRTGLPAARALALADQVSHALEADGLVVALTPPEAAAKLAKHAVTDTAQCEGRIECVAALGTQLQADVVIGIDLAQV